MLLNGKCTFECLFGRPPSYDALPVIGCLAFAHNQKTKGDKFASRSRKCVFLGYPFGKKGWKLYDIEAQECFVSRDVKFVEHIFPFQNSLEPPTSPDFSSPTDYPFASDDYEWPQASPHSSASPPLTHTADPSPPPYCP